jgi:hypothetical protein
MTGGPFSQAVRNALIIEDARDATVVTQLSEQLGTAFVEKWAFEHCRKRPGRPIYPSALVKRYKHRLAVDFWKSVG